VIKKKQYVQICSLKLENSNYKYTELAKTLNIPVDEVEIWAIEAIAAGIIDAKIDQIKEEIVIKSHILNKEWQAIKERLSEWGQRFSTMQSMLSVVK
jgi:translation initiation factor 3 subunit M